MRHHRSIWTALVGVAWVGLALAQAPRANAPSAEEVQQRLADAKARLDLTPDQEQRLRPLLEEEGAKLRGIQAKSSDQTSREDRRAALHELRAVRERVLAVEHAGFTGEALAHDLGVAVDENAHGFL